MRKRKEPSRKDSVDLARAQIEAILEETGAGANRSNFRRDSRGKTTDDAAVETFAFF